MKKRMLYALLSVFFVAGCTGEEITNESTEQIEVTDTKNQTVQVPADPKRVGVFDNAQIDNMDALGLGERIVVTASSQLPAYLKAYEAVEVAGTLHEVDLEIAMSTQPDLAIVASRSASSYELLSEFIPTVDLSLTAANTFQSLQENLRVMATIFSKEKEAEQLIEKLEEEKQELSEQAEASELTALMVMYNGGSLSAFGPSSRFGHVYDDFGFTPIDENIDRSNHGMEISYEYILQKDPDVVFVLDRSSAISEGENVEPAINHFEENPLLEATTAFEKEAIYYLTPDAWYLSNGGAQAYQIMMDDVWKVFQE